MTDDEIVKVAEEHWSAMRHGGDSWLWEFDKSDLLNFARVLLAAGASEGQADAIKILEAPKVIYLQCGDLEDIDDPVLFNNLDGVTWCQDRIDSTDIEYVRAAELTALREQSADWERLYNDMAKRFSEANHEIAALRERIAGMEKDAERWRAWLPIRDHYRWDVCSEKEATQIVDDTIAEQKETKQ